MSFLLFTKQKVFIGFFAILIIVLFIGTLVVVNTPPSFTQQSLMRNMFCMLLSIIYGPLGNGISVLTAVILCLCATLQKISWKLAITINIGLMIIYIVIPLVAYSGGYTCYAQELA